MKTITRFSSFCVIAAIAPASALCSATVYTNQASWQAAVQADGYSLVRVSFANPSAWTASNYSVGTEGFNGLTSNQTSNGMSVTIDDAAFESVFSSISIQNNSLMDSEQATEPERDTSFLFRNAVYAFGGDYTVNCVSNSTPPCAASTFFLSAAPSLQVAGPDASGFWGIVVTPDAGTQQFVQGINACPPPGPDGVNCYFN